MKASAIIKLMVKKWDRLKAFAPKRTKVLISMSILLLIIVVSVLTCLYYFNFTDAKYDQSDPAFSRLIELKETDVPKTPADRTEYYASLANNYGELNDQSQALKNLILADENIADRSLATGSSVNIGIARLYQAQNGIADAKKYFQKEIDRINGDPLAAENAGSVKYYQAEMAKLK